MTLALLPLRAVKLVIKFAKDESSTVVLVSSVDALLLGAVAVFVVTLDEERYDKLTGEEESNTADDMSMIPPSVVVSISDINLSVTRVRFTTYMNEYAPTYTAIRQPS